MILFAFQNALFAQFSDLGGKTAAVNLKIVGKLLTVKGDIKGIAVHLLGAQHQIGHQLFSRASFGSDLYALMEFDRLGRKILH